MENRNSLRCYLILNIIHLSEETVYLKFSQPFNITLIEISVTVFVQSHNVQLVIDITGTKISQILRYQ